MKRILLYLLLALFILSCEEDGTGANNSKAGNTSGGDGQGGSLATFALVGDYLYVVDDASLNVFNISDASNPTEVNTVPVGFQIETLFSREEFLYIGSRNGMFIYGIEEPEFPRQLASVSHFTACDPVVANDAHAFVTLHTNITCRGNVNVLEIYDIADIERPRLISTTQMAGPKGLGLFNDYLIVCDNEIKVFDISDPTRIKIAETINEVAFDVIIRGHGLIAIGENGLYQYSISTEVDGISFEHLSTIMI